MPAPTQVWKVASGEPLFNVKGYINCQSATPTELEVLHSTVPCPAGVQIRKMTS